MIHEEICTYEVCKLAKEKGFNWMPSMYFHSGVERDLREVGVNGANPNKIPHSPHISCPTQTQLQRWLREEKGIHITLDCELNYEYDIFIYVWRIDYRDSDNRNKVHSKYSKNAHYTYELALKEAIVYALVNLI